MISAKLIKDLEKEGFRLDFPGYDSNTERIIEVLKENNPRLNLAIPLLLRYTFDYKIIIKRADKATFDRIIIISNRIFKLEKMDNMNIKEIIKENNIGCEIKKDEFDYYYGSFKAFLENRKGQEEEIFREQTLIRGRLNTNQALTEIFAPGQLRIMDKIFHHEPLTNTELKYYYRAIRPRILAMLNDDMRRYARIIDSVRKIKA
jgi:hypothetical protein